jgi:VWFA-related protein
MPQFARSIVAVVLTVSLLPLSAQGPARTPAPAPPPPPPSQDTPTFRQTTRYIEVDAVVEDRDGRFVPGLTKDDFVLYEDNRQQTIDKVTIFDLPPVEDTATGVRLLNPIAREPRGPQVGPTADAFARASRIYVMVLGSGQTDAVRDLAKLFIERYLAPTDLLAIVHVSRSRGQSLTNDKELLLAAANRYRPVYNQEEQIKTLKEVVVSLGSITGRRRSIVMMGTGFGLWAESEKIHQFLAKYNDLTRTARAFNVPIHSLYADGMFVAPTDLTGNSAPRMTTPGGKDMGQDGAASMRVLADDTGGIQLGNRNGARNGFARVVEANSQYYVLGYYSNLEREERNHPIVVRVTRPDVTVVARRNVRSRPLPETKRVPLPRSMAESTRGLLRRGETSGTIPINVTTTVFRADDFMGSVMVYALVDGRALSLSAGQKLRYSAAAVDAKGDVTAIHTRAFTLNVSDVTRSHIEKGGLQFFSRLLLPPGSHVVRVAVEQDGGGSGVVATTVTVPDFAENTLHFSELSIGPRESSGLAPLNDRTLRRELPAGVTPHRTFAPSEELQIFGEVYDVHWPLVPRLDVHWSIHPVDGGEVVASGKESIESVFGGVARFRGRALLRLFKPGRYLLTTQAVSTMGPPASALAETEFTVIEGGAR